MGMDEGFFRDHCVVRTSMFSWTARPVCRRWEGSSTCLGIRQNAHLEKNVIQINDICSGGNEK